MHLGTRPRGRRCGRCLRWRLPRPDPAFGADPTSLVTFRFKVEQVVKGDLGPQIDVLSRPSPAACGIELAVGQRTGLLLQRSGDTWRSSLCQQVKAEELQGGVPPGVEVRAESGDGGNGLAAALAGVMIVLAAGGSFLWLKRRRTQGTPG